MTARTLDLDLAARLYAEGLALTHIGERVGASHTSVARAIRSNPDRFPPRMRLRRGMKVHHDAASVEAAARLWGEGASWRQIAAAIGCSTTKLDAFRKAFPDRFPDRAPVRSPSVEQACDLALAAELWAQSLPLAAIAARLGVTARALERLVGRRRDLFPKRGAIPRPARAPAGRLAAPRRPAIAATKPAAAPPRAVPASAIKAEAEAEIGVEAEPAIERPRLEDAFRPLRGVAPVDLVAGSGCQWPVHETGDPLRSTARHCCGAPRMRGWQPYCAAHARLSVRVAGTAPVPFEPRGSFRVGYRT